MAKKIKAWWIRKGNEGFLVSNVYMNYRNAKMVCAGRNLSSRTKHRVISITMLLPDIHFKDVSNKPTSKD